MNAIKPVRKKIYKYTDTGVWVCVCDGQRIEDREMDTGAYILNYYRTIQ